MNTINNLKTNFGKRKVKEKIKTRLVQNLFSEVSQSYDLMNDFMSFGSHRLWKKILIEKMNIQNNEFIIDVGSGTGDLIKLIAKQNVKTKIYCIDLNPKMLMQAKKNLKKEEHNDINFLVANAENLPFKKNFFDKYVISFCLRNVTNIEKALSEAYRILKPGGKFYCLEFSVPNSAILNNIYSKYKNEFIPFLGKIIANNKSAYQYLSESINQFPNQYNLKKEIEEKGFEHVDFLNLFDGIVSIHTAHKI